MFLSKTNFEKGMDNGHYFVLGLLITSTVDELSVVDPYIPYNDRLSFKKANV